MGQADLIALTGEASGWALKDFSRRPWWIRHTLARRALRREARALEGLQGIEGMPRFGGMVGKEALLIERLEAGRLPHLRDNFLTVEFFDRLERMVEGMHQRGWAHGDLRRKNILVDGALKPYLIDFATAWGVGTEAGSLRRRLFKHWSLIDRVTLVRIKRTYFPDALTPKDREILRRDPFYLRLGRRLRKGIYRPLKRRHRRRLWRKIRRWLGAPDD